MSLTLTTRRIRLTWQPDRCGLTRQPERSEFSVDDPTNSAHAIVRDDLTWRLERSGLTYTAR